MASSRRVPRCGLSAASALTRPQVRALGFPPAERREDSLAALNGLDMFGAGALRCE